MGSVGSALFSTIFIIFLIACTGYLAGNVKIKGISLGTAGVLIAALVFGIISSYVPFLGAVLGATNNLFSFVSNMGTSMFITTIGLIAGPKFFRTFNRKSLAYILMSVIVVLVAALVTIAVIRLSDDPNMDSSLAVGILTGALTTTPGFSAAREVALNETKVTAGYGIAYLFGVLGVVLFVQFIPRILKINIAKERETFVAANAIEIMEPNRKLILIDPYGVFPFALVIVLGSIIGSVNIPGINFSLGAAGGMLTAGLVIGHFGHIGPIDCRIRKETLNAFREFGLCIFLVGAGVPGGVNFIAYLRLSYFIYGALITLIPMLVGFIFARYVFKMSVFNNLGSITGGMTSTPALGALIAATGTEDVANAYAASYPVALFFVVLAARILVSVM